MNEEAVKYEVQEKKVPMDIDISKGILPKSYNELLQFAALYRDSGLAPKSFQSVQQVAIAIGMCLELDRPILTGIQDMAVINGKVSIYGDAALAIVRRSGLLEYIKETEEGTPYKDDWKFTCTIKRKGSPDPRIGIWTWEDAKRAGFDDPKQRDGAKDIYSPWRRFTRRMMQFKARNFPLRDEFGDVIKGMTLAEDANDSIIDVTPEKPSLGTSAGTTSDKAGAKVYEFKTAEAEKEPPATETKQPPIETNETNETKEPKPDPKREMTARVLNDIKDARPKASEKARQAFKSIYLNNRDFILTLTGSEFEYAKGKFVNAGYDWGNDFLGANQAQAATSPPGEGQGKAEEVKQGPPQVVDFGDTGTEPKEEWLIKAEEYRQAFSDLGPQGEKAWAGILQLYTMVGKDLSTMAPGYRDAFLNRCTGQLDIEIQKKDGR